MLIRVANENPAARPAARARRRSRRSRAATRYATRSPASRRCSPTARRIGPDGQLAHRAAADAGPPRPDLAGRPAALHPRALGRASSATRSTTSCPAGPGPRRSSPRRSAALHLRFGGGRRPGGPAEAPSFAGAADEPEAFSSDSAWMPRVVLMAKSTYVWLDQLSRTYGRADPDASTRIPDEELDTLAALGLHRPLAHRPVGAQPRRRSGSSRCAATPTPSPRPTRSTTTGSPTTSAARRPTRPARPGLGARHPPGQRHGAQPHGHRLALGHRAPRLVPVAAPSRPIPAYSFNGPDLSSDERVGIVPRGPLLGRQRRRGRVQARRPLERRRPATSTTATTARASRGTTPRSWTTSSRRSARRSSRPSSTSRGASRSSASTPR